LNNPLLISPEHWLIEIRIPVDVDSLKYAGTLGQMTDVKLLPAMTVAVAVKPEGQNDPEPAIRSLYAWIDQHGYRIAGGLWQTVFCDASRDYAQMRTEFMIPVVSQAAAKG
jgi:effector-binding domain-containing protein